MWSLAVLGFFLATAQGRAVNISNTWVLPEEGFPVFYRYFRDRISWYEADAVCQFHHANLVTVDTTAQYDAVRAYLKELDISSAVWVGLIRSNPDGDFTWTDYRGLSGDGYWSSAPDPRAAPLCAAADPAADYRWEARTCGGPTVASFICELPVPQWALGNEGCMVKALPALTVLYLPESAAVQLTADCGMAGVKRVQCTGNMKREDLLRGLSCAEEQESSTNSGPTSGASLTSSEGLFTDQDTTNDATTEDNTSSGHTDDHEQPSTSIPHFTHNAQPIITTTQQNVDKIGKEFYDTHVHFKSNSNNNMQSNDIPKLAAGYDNYLSSDLSDKLEDERNMQHKMIHDEIARHGNLQNTDHFVPPLVMAKAKISDDMTVLSLEEKHAQQLAEQRYGKHTHNDNFSFRSKAIQSMLDDSEKINVQETPLITTTPQNKPSDELKKVVQKPVAPKKYVDKQYGHKNKVLKVMDFKTAKVDKTTEINYSTTTEKSLDDRETSTIKYIKTNNENIHKIDDEPTIDLTVIIKEPSTLNNKDIPVENMNLPKIEIIENDTSIAQPKISLSSPENKDGEITQEISVKLPTKSVNNVTFTHEVIKITIVKDENSSEEPTVFEVTTRMPVFEDDSLNESTMSVVKDLNTDNTSSNNDTNVTIDALTTSTTKIIPTTTTENIKATSHVDFVQSTVKPINITKEFNDSKSNHVVSTTDSTVFTAIENITEIIKNENDNSNFKTIIEEDIHEDEDIYNTTDTSQTIDDFQSPLLSGANEPAHRPNRSRRPQQPNKNKFNPFRILG